MHALSFTWLAWMAGTTALYWALPARWRPWGLVAVSAAFLLVHAPLSAAILGGFTLVTFLLARGQRIQGWRVAVLVAILIGILVTFKFGQTIAHDSLVQTWIVPLGLSYYAFRCLHYLLERFKGTLAEQSLAEVVGYLWFLPTFVIGPIHRYQPYQRDRARQRWDPALFSKGLERILYGYVKIAVLANYLMNIKLARQIEGLEHQDGALALYLEVVRKGFVEYFTFAGFSDIAIGFSLLLGYRVMENFDWPYLKKNISDFWRAWHISLSSWCRDYIYGGVIATTRSPALAVLATMLVIGLWHELSLRYLLWGLYHGLGILIWQQFHRLKRHLPTVENQALRWLLDGLSIALTVNFFWFSLEIAASENLLETLQVFRIILFFWI